VDKPEEVGDIYLICLVVVFITIIIITELCRQFIIIMAVINIFCIIVEYLRSYTVQYSSEFVVM